MNPSADTTMRSSFDDTYIPMTSIMSGVELPVSEDVIGLTLQIANVAFVGQQNATNWVLIDAGMPKSADTIISAAESRFPTHPRPKAILLTHGHFDHVGALIHLIEHWQVPVYAHLLELPYLTGQADYPPGDPTVEGGLVSEMSPLFPHKGIQLGSHIHALPADGSVPELPEWQYIHTPGHTPGHVSFFRDSDGLLIAGDAFVTVKQESLYKVLTQTQEISGPPKYFTTDWQSAWDSVIRLNALHPQMALTGHGRPMQGKELTTELHRLAHHFETLGLPQ